MTSLDAVGRDLDAPGSQGGTLRTEMPRVSNCQATRCDVFSTGITILAQLFGQIHRARPAGLAGQGLSENDLRVGGPGEGWLCVYGEALLRHRAGR